MSKTKILMLGPCESGKSFLANFLSEAFETTSGNYRPTHGVRILEFETQGVIVNGKNTRADVELWDVSGDRKFEGCWPAVSKDAGAIIFVYNPDQPGQDKELDQWFHHFVAACNFQDVTEKHCMVMAMRHDNSHFIDPLPVKLCRNHVHIYNDCMHKHTHFTQDLRDSQCIVFAHQKPSTNGGKDTHLSSVFGRISVVTTSIDEDPDAVRIEFTSFLGNLLSVMSDKREREELSIMNSRA